MRGSEIESFSICHASETSRPHLEIEACFAHTTPHLSILAIGLDCGVVLKMRRFSPEVTQHRNKDGECRGIFQYGNSEALAIAIVRERLATSPRGSRGEEGAWCRVAFPSSLSHPIIMSVRLAIAPPSFSPINSGRRNHRHVHCHWEFSPAQSRKLRRLSLALRYHRKS